MSSKKCPHFKRRDQWCKHCSKFSININLNTKGKQLNEGHNVKEYIYLGYNGMNNQQAIDHLVKLVNKEKSHLLPYANNRIVRNNILDTVIDYKDLRKSVKGSIESLSRKRTQY